MEVEKNSTMVDLDQLIQASRKNFRIDVVGLANRLGLSVYSVDMPDDCSGTIKYDSPSYIEVNRNHPVTRQRFSIAHEIAHFLKHNQVLIQKGQMDRNANYKDDAEIQLEHDADKEAAAILMPEKLVTEYLTNREWSKKTKFNAEMIGEIADEFRVSRAMAVTRLRELHLPIPYLSFA